MVFPFMVVSILTLMTALAGFINPWSWALTFMGLGEIGLSMMFVRENERLKPVLLGKLMKEIGVTLTEDEKRGWRDDCHGNRIPVSPPDKGLFGTGIVFLLFPFFRVHRFPMTMQQIPIEVGRVVTMPGKSRIGKGRTKELRNVGSAELNLEVNVNFQWDVSHLSPAVVNAPSPIGPDGRVSAALVELIRPEVDDAMRRVASRHTWVDVYNDRNKIEKEIEETLLDPRKAGGLALRRSGITDSACISISLPKVELPDALRTVINNEEVAIIEARAAMHRADGEKYRLERVGEGEATARRILFATIRGGGGDETAQNQLAEKLLTLREAAKGGKAILFPTDLFNLTATATGSRSGRNFMDLLESMTQGLAPDARQRILDEGINFLRRLRITI